MTEQFGVQGPGQTQVGDGEVHRCAAISFGLCLSSNRGGRVRRLIWTLSAFMLDGMGGWLVSLVVVYFMSEWVFR